MQDVDPRASPFGKDRGAAHGLNCDHRRARCEMRQRINAAGIPHARLATLHNRIGLGMKRNSLPGRGDHFERLEHCAGRWRRDLAESVAHVELKADDRLGELRHMPDRVFAEQPVKAEIDMRLLGCHLMLGRQDLRRARRRDGVRHVEHGGHAAEGRRRRAGGEILLVRIAGIAEVHVHIDGAGQHVQALRVERLARWRHRLIGADRDNDSILDGNAGIDDGVRRDHPAAADDEID